MTSDSLLAALRDSDVMLPLLCSLVAGALVGVEREFQGKPAGLRTHTLVCFASALMTLVGLRMGEWTAQFPMDTQIVSDMARMPHAILTGIGFLGAGVIFREGATVQGLTTAASLWLTAALGIVFGVGLLELGTIGTAIALIVLVLLRMVQRVLPPKPELRVEISVKIEDGYDAAQLASTLTTQGLRVGSMSIEEDRSTGLRRYRILASETKKPVDAEGLLRALNKSGALQEVAIAPLEHNPDAGR
jgi:putative Mg2+ transporter-C (MgtC) family protein